MRFSSTILRIHAEKTEEKPVKTAIRQASKRKKMRGCLRGL